MPWRRAALALLLLALVCAGLPLLADSTARIVRLSYLDGDVQIDRGTGHGLERAVLNMPVVQGTQLATRDGGAAEVEFEDGSTLRLVPGSTVRFNTLTLRDNGSRVSIIDLAQGTVYLEATTKKDQFSITAAGQQITLARDGYLRIRRGDPALAVAVFKGEADVQNPTGSVRVKKDETLNLNVSDSSQYELAKGIDSDTYDTWSQQRDDYRKTYAANHHDRYNPLYSYGWSDLNFFGGFNQYPGYGYLWRPYGMGPGWDPFADGAWMYYPGFGYTWVSGYPWGWMPYRYGQWMFVPGMGWGWSPATYWNSWYAVPVVYGAPAGYVAPKPPPIRPGANKGFGTVVVGAGPLNDVRNPHYREWLDHHSNPRGIRGNARVTPVPPPVSTGVQTTVPGKTTTGPAGTTSSPSPGRTTNPRHNEQSTYGGSKRTTSPPSRSVTPPPSSPPPRMEQPRMSTPPMEQPHGWSGGEGSGRGEGGASRSAPHK